MDQEKSLLTYIESQAKGLPWFEIDSLTHVTDVFRRMHLKSSEPWVDIREDNGLSIDFSHG